MGILGLFPLAYEFFLTVTFCLVSSKFLGDFARFSLYSECFDPFDTVLVLQRGINSLES